MKVGKVKVVKVRGKVKVVKVRGRGKVKVRVRVKG